MNRGYHLPVQHTIGARVYDLNTDFRELLDIIDCLEDSDLPPVLRWQIAMGLFYRQPVCPEHRQQAMEYLAFFLTAGRQDSPGPKLLDWQQDADAIISGVNRVAGQELRAVSYVHWWTFLSWFHAIGEGELSYLVSIRSKLAKGKKLETHEQEFYRQNKSRVDLKPRYSQQELLEQQRLNALLG